MLLREAFDVYKRDVIVFSNQSKKTEENHDIAVKNLIAFTGNVELVDLTFDKVREWKQHLDNGRSAETVRNYIIKLRVVLAYLKHQGYQCLDPDAIPVPRRTDKVPSFLSSDDVTKLISGTNKVRNKAIISLLYASGVRVSELCSLNRDSIREGAFPLVGKGGKARLCFVDERTLGYLETYLASRTDSHPHLFGGKYAAHRITPGNVQEIFRIARRKSGVNAHPHTMRHSFATNLMTNGMHIYTLSRLMGHASLDTTKMYLHVTDPQLQEEYGKHHTI